MRTGLFTTLILSMLVAAGCSETQYIQPDTVISDAHGGGSVLRAAHRSDIIASGGWSGEVKLWQLPDGKLLQVLHYHQGHITGLAFIANDRVVISAGYDGRIIYSSLDGSRLREVMTEPPITALATNEVADLMISGHKDGSIRIWSISQLAIKQRLQPHTDWIRAIAYDENRQLLASADAGGHVIMWNIDGSIRHQVQMTSDIRTLAFSPDGAALYGGGWFDLYKWDTTDMGGQVLDTEHAGIINSIKLAQQGKILYSISRQTDSSVLAIDPQTGTTRQRFLRHDLCGTTIELSHDERYLISSSDDASIRVWRLKP